MHGLSCRGEGRGGKKEKSGQEGHLAQASDLERPSNVKYAIIAVNVLWLFFMF